LGLTRPERVLGPDHPHALALRGNLANAYQEAGRAAEAIALNEQTLAIRERVLGADHPGTLLSRNNLANTYWAAGRAAEAIPLNEQTLAIRERVLGPDHPDTCNRGLTSPTPWPALTGGQAGPPKLSRCTSRP